MTALSVRGTAPPAFAILLVTVTVILVSSLIQQAANSVRLYCGEGGFKLDGAISARMAEDGSEQED